MHQSIFVFPQTFSVTIVTMDTTTCVSVILPINRQISLFLFYFGTATWQCRRNIYASTLIVPICSILGKHDVIHKTGST